MIETYVSVPLEVEAIQLLDQESADEIVAWLEELGRVDWRVAHFDTRILSLEIATLAGTYAFGLGDWIIRNPVTGEFGAVRQYDFPKKFAKKETDPDLVLKLDGTDG